MAAAGNGGQGQKSDVDWAASDNLSPEPGNKQRGRTAASGLAGGKERWLMVGCGDDSVVGRLRELLTALVCHSQSGLKSFTFDLFLIHVLNHFRCAINCIMCQW